MKQFKVVPSEYFWASITTGKTMGTRRLYKVVEGDLPDNTLVVVEPDGPPMRQTITVGSVSGPHKAIVFMGTLTKDRLLHMLEVYSLSGASW